MNNSLLDEQRISSIETRTNASTSDPWTAMLEGRDHLSGSSCIVTANGDIDLSGASDADIEFMAHARQDVPYLISELRRLASLLNDTNNR